MVLLKFKVLATFCSFSAVISLGYLLRNAYSSKKDLVKAEVVEIPLPLLKNGYDTVSTVDVIPERVRRRVSKFLLFFGSGKSGHSIVGSLLDAHKHIVVSHEYHLFRNWNHVKGNTTELWVENLYNELYWKSRNDSVGIRQAKNKGYSLKVNGLWQGRYEDFISVIGDKSGGSTRQEYVKNKQLFKERLNSLSMMLKIPIKFIHVVRNPFDHVASRVLYAHVGNISAVSAFKRQLNGGKFKDNQLVLSVTKEMLSFYEAERGLAELIQPENILEVHISDLVSKPKMTLQFILKFLEVSATSRYLQVCSAKVYRRASHSRDYVKWPVEAKELLNDVIVKYAFLHRYSFESD